MLQLLFAYLRQALDALAQKLLPFLRDNKEHIAYLAIIGHTSKEWKGIKEFKSRYLHNMDLSLKRAYATIEYLLKQAKPKDRKLLSSLLLGGGRSFADAKSSARGSRRIVISIIPLAKSTTASAEKSPFATH